MKIFISHSQKDKEVAKRFKKVFVNFGKYWMPNSTNVEVFLSSDISIEQRKTDQWRENFEKNLEESSVFVILVSPKSLNSRWVQYETGYVSARNASRTSDEKIRIYQIGIEGVPAEECLLSDTYEIKIKDHESIIKICTDIFEVSPVLARGWYKINRQDVEDLLTRCTERCVYFVGSVPKNIKSDSDKIKKWESFAGNFIEGLTKELLAPQNEALKQLRLRFKVASFPSVNEVGKQVFITAISNNHADKYEVAGLYGFDKKPNVRGLEKLDEKTWKETLNKYRELYLGNKSSMIVLGGNNHTKDEYEVAQKLGHIEIFPIPCMGGFGKEQFEQDKQKDEWKFEKFDHPCRICYEYGKYKNQDHCKHIHEFAMRLGKYIYIDEDERES